MGDGREGLYAKARASGKHHRCPECGEYCWPLRAEVEQLTQDQNRWLAWSGGQYPDDSPGDIISAEVDGMIVLDDGVTTWNPLRALAWFKDNAATK
jgi:hypothetical protein